MPPVDPLPAERLRRTCDPKLFPFETTAEVEPLEDSLGQPRAMEALEFGVGMRRDGYNAYVLGPAGTGRHRLVQRFLEQQAAGEPRASDWCYVHNFADPHRPRALRLPAGRGAAFRKDMEALLAELRAAIPAAFEGEDYEVRKQALADEFKQRREEAFEELSKQAKEQGIALVHTPTGIAMAPIKDDEILGTEDFEKLPQEEQERIKALLESFGQQLQGLMRQVPQWAREERERLRELNREITRFAIEHLIAEARERWADQPAVLEHLQAIQDDMLDHSEQFRAGSGEAQEVLPGLSLQAPQQDANLFRRYEVNLLVTHDGAEGAPVLFADQPSHHQLIGRVEHQAQMGALITDFTLVKPGDLHRANGGYLLLDAHKVLMQPYAWEGLKTALRSREVRIESVAERLSLVSTVSLEPEPIPLDVKVVLVGEPMLYYLLSAYDTEFSDLFKVPVEFDDRLAWCDDACGGFARLLAAMARRFELRPLHREAVARLVEEAARMVGDAHKLSARVDRVADLAREADYQAGKAGRDVVVAEDVTRAVEAQVRRSDRLREREQEEISRGTILIDVQGRSVGQVNGLSVMQLGSFAFGLPRRITARVRLGRGEVLDIEREVELGGPLHSKGVLILSGFLAGRYCLDRPLSLSASLVFEQSYGGVDGDSASSAELYTLLSALSDVPLRQDLAVTGSVNQHGQVQAIGGVNHKIEGFFDVCRRAGLTGDQGVLVPASNVQHMMLRPDVVEAVAEGRFHVWPVEHVDQGIELLTGLPAGARDDKGRFPPGTLNARVEDRLVELADQARQERGGDETDPPAIAESAP